MKKMGAILGAMAAAMGMGNSPSFMDSKDVQEKDEGRTNPILIYRSPSQGIFIPSKSQRVKSQKLRASNKRQGRV